MTRPTCTHGSDCPVHPEVHGLHDYPRLAEFKYFTMRQGADAMYGVTIANAYGHMFRVSADMPESGPTAGGALSLLRFSTYDEAVKFGEELAPLIERAADARQLSLDYIREAQDIIRKRRTS